MRIGLRRRGDLTLFRARLRADHVNVPILCAIRVVAALGHKRDLVSIGRPGRQKFIMFARGDDVDLARREIEQLQVRPAIDQIAVDVVLEEETIDDDRWNGLLLFFLLLRLARVGIVHNEHNAL